MDVEHLKKPLERLMDDMVLEKISDEVALHLEQKVKDVVLEVVGNYSIHLDTLYRLESQMKNEMYDNVNKIAKIIGYMSNHGYETFGSSNGYITFHKDIKIVADKIKYDDKLQNIDTDEFYAEGLYVVVDIDSELIDNAYFDDAYHPNVDMDVVGLYGEDVHKACLGTMEDAIYMKVNGVEKLYKTINMDSTYGQSVDDDAEAYMNFDEDGTVFEVD